MQSKSGTGKTAVYVVIALEMVQSSVPGLQCLVVAPTRELAVQGASVAQQLGSSLPGLKVAAFIGGTSVAEDKVKARNCHLGVGTPGRLKQLITEGLLPTEGVRLVVLDEADKLLEPAFLTDTTDILNLMPRSKQVLALSATYPDQLASLAERFMRAPQHIRPGQASQVLHGVTQLLLPTLHSPAPAKQSQLKQAALLNILSCVPYSQALVFSNYSTIAQATCDFLNSRGFPAVFMSSGQDQERRNAVIQTFKQFGCRILCSTDLTARGIDAENVNLVVNLEVPWCHNTYLHRIGRGGRFGSLSLAVTLASEGEEVTKLRGVVAKTGSLVKILPEVIPQDVRGGLEDMEVLEGAEPEKENKAKKIAVAVGKIKEEIGSKEDCSSKDGKIKRRGKKKPGMTSLPLQDKTEVTDAALVRRAVAQVLRDTETPSVACSLEEVTELVARLEAGEEVGVPGLREVSGEGQEMLGRLGEAVARRGEGARERYREVVAGGREALAGRGRGEVLKELLGEGRQVVGGSAGESSEDSDSEEDDKVEVQSSEEEEDDSDEESEDTSSDDSSDNDEDSRQPSFPPHQQPWQPGQPLPHQPPFPHLSVQQQAAQAWYSQWTAGLEQQRQQLQWQEYWAAVARSPP